MALFFFHFFDGANVTEDDTGVDIPTIELAYLEAGATALEMWPELLADRVSPIDCAFDIANAQGAVMLRFEFHEIMEMGRIGSAQPSASLEIMCSAIAETHRRARRAKAELDETLVEFRQAVDEAKSLLEQFSR